MKEETESILNRSLKQVKGVGDARAALFRKLGVYTVRDMLTYFPREYEDRSDLRKINMLPDGEACAFEGELASAVTDRRQRRGLTIQKAYITDGTGMISAVWFNQPFIKNSLTPGSRYVFYGKTARNKGTFEVRNPVFEKVTEGEMKNTCRIVPVYPATARLSQNVIRAVIRSALDLAAGSMEEIFSRDFRNTYGLNDINYSISNIHFPQSDAAFRNARLRLVFEELFLLQLGLLTIKYTLKKDNAGIRFPALHRIEGFLQDLPFVLTNAQKKVLSEIEKDMESPSIMNRLIQGDVGSGKTVVAALALLKAVKSGYQGAFMVPTEILARQHSESVGRLMEKFGVKTSLLTGSQTKKEKAEILEDIKEGRTDIVIGTHALLEENVEFGRLGLVVTDEQHRFGVRQRAALSKKGDNPDILVMTATPIPRTLALILYGDLDISVIDELPPGRKPVQTYAVDSGMRPRINAFIRKNVAEGRQVYIVCPLVEDSDAVEAKSAAALAERIAKADFKDLRVGLIHGKMKAAEKEAVMEGFVGGAVDILVSTTVIEVGVNVPNASVMVVENAERFGLSQLHQLRGRVGRGEHQSYCILYNESRSEAAKQRMDIMQKSNDGFVISEKDLELRGPGDFFGTRQHGLPDLKIANLYRDIDILKQAQAAAAELLEKDPRLRKTENEPLRRALRDRFPKNPDI